MCGFIARVVVNKFVYYEGLCVIAVFTFVAFIAFIAFFSFLSFFADEWVAGAKFNLVIFFEGGVYFAVVGAEDKMIFVYFS